MRRLRTGDVPCRSADGGHVREDGAADPAPDAPAESLRSRSLVSAVWMFAREGGGIAIRLVGVLLLTRLLGPSDFGIYAGALAVVTVLATLSQLSSEVFLLRRPRSPTSAEVGTVYSLLFGVGGAVVALALAGCLLADRLGLPEQYLGPFRVMLIGLILNVLWAPSQAALERAFRYRAVGTLELSGDVILYAVAIPLAIADFGAYAPAWGYVAWQAFLLVGSSSLSKLWLRPRWDRGTARDVVRFAGSYTPVHLFPRLGDLVNPIVVGALLGPAAVGYVALAVRMTQTVGFVGRTAYRIALVVMAQLSDDVPRMSRAFRQALGLQALGVGVPLVGLAVASPWLLPFAFGEQWRPALQVLPFIMVGVFITDLFSLHAHVLTVKSRTRNLAATYGGLFVAHLVGTSLLVPVLGIRGFGVSAVLALVALVPLHLGVRAVFPPVYDQALPWIVGLAPLMLTPLVDGRSALLLAIPLLVVLALPASRRQLAGHGIEIWTALKR